MKKIILNKVLFVCLLILSFFSSYAQLHIVKDFHIANGGIVFVKGVQVQFATAASTTTTTTRTVTTYGKLWMDVDASLATIGAANFPTANHFMDGYVRSNETTQFLYPVGQSGVLGIAATIGTTTDPIDVAYLRAAGSTLSSNFAYNVTGVSTVEYWDMIGTAPARVSLTWRNTSNLTALGINFPEQLAIAALNISTNTWEVIPATIDATSILTGASSIASNGSISTTGNVNLANYRFFTFAKLKEGCLPLTANSGGTTIWTGTWSNGTPNDTKIAQINSPYSAGSFTCNALVLNADLTLSGTQFIDCVNGVTGAGKVIMSTNSNFLQRNSSTTTPTIKMNKIVPSKRLYDWTYFGSPLTDGELTALETATAAGGTLDKAYYSYRVWRHGINNLPSNWWGVHSNTSNPSYQSFAATQAEIVPGMGFIGRVKFQAPFFSPTTIQDININIEGTTNNGNIQRTTSNTTLNDSQSTVLLGNPYPSAIDANIFIRENLNITGTLYFWSSKTEYAPGGGTGFYVGADFATYNLSGGVGTASGATAPNQFIATSQGFNVRSSVATQPIVFNNCMRVSVPSTTPNFYRQSTENQDNEKNRFWLSISNSENQFYNESLIAYLPETTLGYDRMYDGISVSGSEYTITSLLNNDKYTIQSRSTFNATDVVPLHVKKEANYSGTLNISLKDKEGIFNQSDVTIFLHDTELNIYHNLEVSPYTFTLNDIETSTRFKIVYQSSNLNDPNFDLNSVNITLFKNNFKVNAKDLISNITIFDIAGRMIESYKNINNIDFNSNFNHEDGIYIAKVVLSNGNVVSQKITNLNK